MLPQERLSPSSPNDRRATLRRAWLFGTLIALLFFGLITRLWYLQIVHGDDYRAAALANQGRRIRTRAPRGIIVDRHGELLAGNRSQFAVYATPDILKNPAALSRLAGILHETPTDIQQTIHDIQQNPYDPLRVALDKPISVVTQIEENRPYLPGVSTAPEPVRWYPKISLAAQVLGTMGRITPDQYQSHRQAYLGGKSEEYFSDDFIGQSGLERSYESYLHGTPGGTDVQIDARGRRTRTLDTQSARPGGTVVLSVDARVQAAAEQALHENNFIGAAVAINPQTGAVLAMASAPTYDPNKFATGISASDWKPIHSDPSFPLINRTVDAMYAPGSTFKPIVAAAGLQTGAMTTQSTAYSPGYYYLGRQRFGDWKACGEVNFYTAIAVSCDVFFYIYGQKIGPDRMSAYAKDFGLAEKTGIDLPGEDIGSIPSPAWKARRFKRYGPQFTKWYGGDTLHMSIGQGDVLVTPLQMARVAATLANGGDVLRPFLVDHVTDSMSGRSLFTNTRTLLSHVPVSAQNMESVRQGMRVCVTHGTGKVVDLKPIAVAAKTGSAQTTRTALTHGWFICFAPYDHPTIAIAAIVEHGGHGADTAGRVARAMLQTYFHQRVTHGSGGHSD